MKQGSGVGYWDRVWTEFRKDSLAYASFFFVVLLAATALFESFLAGNRPIVLVEEGRYYFPVLIDYPELRGQDLRAAYLDDADSFAIFPPVKYSPTESDFFSVLAAPDGNHFLGTDDRGRDVLSRMIHGARISLSIGVVAVGIAMVIGIMLGAVAGYYGGWIDFAISRLIEVMITFPVFFLILTILAFTEPSIYNIMIVIGVTGWTGVARLVRGGVPQASPHELRGGGVGAWKRRQQDHTEAHAPKRPRARSGERHLRGGGSHTGRVEPQLSRVRGHPPGTQLGGDNLAVPEIR